MSESHNRETGDRSATAREAILERVRSANKARLNNQTQEAGLPDAVKEHMRQRRSHTLPSWSQPADNTERLLEQMEQVQISCVRVQTRADVAQAVAEYVREQDIPGELIVAPELAGDEQMQWPADTLSGGARGAVGPGVELTSVTPCLCAVAETGSIVTSSNAQRPATLNYLPDNHVVVLHENQIVKHTDGAWAVVRERADEVSDLATEVPRAVNFLTGPSRTADIEQTLELGAHGPRRMHVILVASDSPE